MGLKYQLYDFAICDYELYSLPGAPDLLRGPPPQTLSGAGDYVSFLGGAQTFGALCRHPYPNLLGSMLGVEILNLGFGGAGPRLYLDNPDLFEYINRGHCCVVIVMAGRSSPNSLMINPRGGNLMRWRSDPPDAKLRQSRVLYEELLDRSTEKEILRIVDETRDSWVEDYRRLADRIHVPKILFWMSGRRPDYALSVSSVHQLYGAFPMLIDSATLARISGHFDQLVMSVCREGLPAPLLDRFTGRPTSVQRDERVLHENGYYPSQHMHLQASLALYPEIAARIPSRG